MSIAVVSSVELEKHPDRTRELAGRGPVFITEGGKPTHVLLSIEDYQRLIVKGPSIVEVLGMPPGVEDIEVEFPCSRDLPRAADFS